MKNIIPLALPLLLLAYSAKLHAQCNTTPCSIPMPSVNAADACVNASPSALDCYYGETTSDAPISFPPFWCSAIHNNHWFAFVADAPIASFDIACYGCAVGNGIQAAVLSTADCVNFTFESPCIGNIPSGTQTTLTTFALVPGQTYYLCIDGSSGAQCEYSINATLPTVNGPDELCFPSTSTSVYTTTSMSTWTINPPSAGIILGNTIATSVTVSWQETGDVQVCAQSTQCPNAPVECLDVHIGNDVFVTENVDLCQGKNVECAGRTFTTAGTFPVPLETFDGCDSVVTCIVKLIPTVYTDQTVLLCQGESVTCAGEEFFNPGTYPVTFQSYTGCDSIVRCKVQLVPPVITPQQFITLCGPTEIQICENTVNASGIYQETCESWLGCDSIVNVNLAILEPEAVIDPPAVLDCTVNTTIPLTAINSAPPSGTNVLTFYSWTGPGI
ncbi:MAG: hypothetical protein SFV52_04045, partial [Saprospiraceae bacterium]|nr:hypothetical protein [Saprospiraceae bacterium]